MLNEFFLLCGDRLFFISDFLLDEVWLYWCCVCDVFMYVDCFSVEIDEDFSDDEDDEEDEDLGVLY